MRNQKGSAVALVMLFLGVVSMIGAGLMLQSQDAIKFSASVKNVDSMLNMADAAAFEQMEKMPPLDSGPTATYTGDAKVEDDAVIRKVQGQARYTRRAIFVDLAEASECAGYEIDSGGGVGQPKVSASYWVAEGRGRTAAGRNSETIVTLGCVRCERATK